MEKTCTIQLFANGVWHDVGGMSLLDEEQHGWKARTYTAYSADWAVLHTGRRDAHAFACQFPVRLEAFAQPHWPVFLLDALPQGFGREELLRRLDLSPAAGIEADWRLLLAGAGNPIGNLRVKEAASWLMEQQGPLLGFTDDEVAQRGEEFTEYLASQGLFVAGSSGVQGEWPKILLTRAEDGLLYLDHGLPDQRAREHFIVKFGRGPDIQLATILRHEAPYMALARLLGLRVFAPLHMRERALFIPRFDRLVSKAGVQRFGQESIATLTGTPGFGAAPTHDEVCRQLIARCTDPEREILEYLKRDIANIALGNKDNHARNMALQRDFNGRVSLTPLYDFMPMYLHPDGIARRIRWEGNDDGKPDWARVIERVVELAAPRPDMHTKRRRHRGKGEKPPFVRREVLVAGLKTMVPGLRRIAADGATFGLDEQVHADLRIALEAHAARLDALV